MESHAKEMPTFGDLTNVSIEKLQDLDTILATILALPIARETFTQIIDGKPTRTFHSQEDQPSHDINDHAKPSDRATQEYETIKKTFASQDLIIDLKVRDPFLSI